MTARRFGRCSQVYESPGCGAVTRGRRAGTGPPARPSGPPRPQPGHEARPQPGHQARPQADGWPLVPV